MLEVLDSVCPVGPAVGVHDVVGDALAVTLDGLTEVLFAGQHGGEEEK